MKIGSRVTVVITTSENRTATARAVVKELRDPHSFRAITVISGQGSGRRGLEVVSGEGVRRGVARRRRQDVGAWMGHAGCTQARDDGGASVLTKLKPGDRVSVVYMNGDGHDMFSEVRRGLVGGHYDVRDAFDPTTQVWLNFLWPNAEGIVWARGWDTPAARALRSAVALLDPKDR